MASPRRARTWRRARCRPRRWCGFARSEEHTSELQSLRHLVCRLLLEKKNAFGVMAQIEAITQQSIFEGIGEAEQKGDKIVAPRVADVGRFMPQQGNSSDAERKSVQQR